MIKKKKTMYELLEVSPNASYAEIKTAYQRLSQNLQTEKTDLNREVIDFRMNLINVAFHTLSSPASRDSYDAQLISSNTPANVVTPGNSVVLKPTVEALYLRADAASLRADAASLRADAILLRADATSLKVVSKPYEENHESPLKMISLMFAGLASPLKKILTILGSVVAVIMVLQVVFLLVANRKTEITPGSNAEKLYLQQYYQENGVRPASKIEADLLDAENRRLEIVNRNKVNEQRSEEREKQRLDDENRRFVEEARRLGEKVSENVRRDEERARNEEERKQQRLDEEKRRQEEAEINRIEREKARWSNSNYSSPNYNRYETSNE